MSEAFPFFSGNSSISFEKFSLSIFAVRYFFLAEALVYALCTIEETVHLRCISAL